MPIRGKLALAILDWSLHAADLWHRHARSRDEILESVSLNRLVGDTTLVATKRKPSDVLAEGLLSENSRATGHR